MKKIKLGDIYFIENPRLGKSMHGHPCLVTGVTLNSVFVSFISSKFDLKGSDDLMIEKSDGFGTTGLKFESFIIANPITAVSMTDFLDAKYLGFISGELKIKIEKWWGSKLN